MKFENLLNENLIVLDLDLQKKEDIIEKLVEKLYENGGITSKESFFKAVMKRESVSPTGLEEGLAIPHGKDESVIKPMIAVARLKNSIKTWESVDEDNEVNMIFLIAIPKKEEGDSHIEVLSKLTTSFMKEGFISKLQEAKTKKEMLDIIYSVEDNEEKKIELSEDSKFIIAVTSCATGIAHTYLAAEALEKAARELGIRIQVEKQGAKGIENRLTKEQIEKAEVVIFATDVSVKEIERFAGKKYLQTRVAVPLKAGKETIEKALKTPTGIVEGNVENSSTSSDEKVGVLEEIKRAFLTGISYMIPLIVAGALIMGIARIGASAFGIVNIGDPIYNDSTNIIVRLFHVMDSIGGKGLGLMLPFIGGYVAYALGDRVAIAPGFIGGVLAKELSTGFIGALIAGIIAGYTGRFIIQKIKLPKSISGITSIFVAPVLGVLVTGLSMVYIIGEPLASMNKFLEVWLMGLSGSNKMLLAAVIGGMVGFDLGGPVNKVAVTTSMALLSSGITIPNTVAMITIVVPPIGLGLATLLGKAKYNQGLRESGKSSILMGCVGISEGAIPFAIESPLKVIPINVIGCAITGALTVFFNVDNPVPIAGIHGWLLAKNWPLYIVAMLVGALFIAVANVMLRKNEND
ncbi:fructose-specific PTS transporter subunit EIIC [Fusobacterium perfoetens]|uniref:fructose-specific PTS transporter subunit EIIC n=1 Tax=Fusobacterium perfoetens TaxID=852 RepID=UPI0026F08207|nr:fructose-specific PTS transporter subunit EIIC [Fusobacterium perfoetens]